MNNDRIADIRADLKKAIEEEGWDSPHLGSTTYHLVTEDIPYLLEQLARARAQIGKLIVLAGDWKEAADKYYAEVEDLREAQRWIPVAERLPQTYRHEEGEPIEFMVCLLGAKEATALCFNGSQWFEFDWTNGRVAGYYTVTHWMPLPALPEKGD